MFLPENMFIDMHLTCYRYNRIVCKECNMNHGTNKYFLYWKDNYTYLLRSANYTRGQILLESRGRRSFLFFLLHLSIYFFFLSVLLEFCVRIFLFPCSVFENNPQHNSYAPFQLVSTCSIPFVYSSNRRLSASAEY